MKKSSYQKQKDKIEELENKIAEKNNHIRVLLQEPNSNKAASLTLEYDIIFATEDALMASINSELRASIGLKGFCNS